MHLLHLDDEKDIGPDALSGKLRQLPQMLDATLRRRVGKAGHAVVLQSHALDLQIALLSRFIADEKIQTRVSAYRLGLHDLQPPHTRQGQCAGKQGLLCHLVGRLGVHIDQQRRGVLPLLFHGDKGISQLSAAHTAGEILQIDPRPRQKQLPAAPGVLHMHRRFRAVQADTGDKTVGAFQKDRGADVRIDHCFCPFRCRRQLSVPEAAVSLSFVQL